MAWQLSEFQGQCEHGLIDPRISQASANTISHNALSAEKRVVREPDGSLAAIAAASSMSCTISSDEIQRRYDAVLKQLSDKHMYVIDVAKNGNCFFRALSVNLQGDQNNHASLRACIAKYITGQAKTALPADKAALLKCEANIATNGVWAGDDIIRAAVDCLQRSIQLLLPIEIY